MKMDEDGWWWMNIHHHPAILVFVLVFTNKVLTDCHRPVSSCGGNSSVTLLSVGSIQHFAGETFIFDCWKPYVCDLNPVLLVSSFFSAGQNYSNALFFPGRTPTFTAFFPTGRPWFWVRWCRRLRFRWCMSLGRWGWCLAIQRWFFSERPQNERNPYMTMGNSKHGN